MPNTGPGSGGAGSADGCVLFVVGKVRVAGTWLPKQEKSSARLHVRETLIWLRPLTEMHHSVLAVTARLTVWCDPPNSTQVGFGGRYETVWVRLHSRHLRSRSVCLANPRHRARV
jgi:hypothetical protein